jgi:hypothetical protein
MDVNIKGLRQLCKVISVLLRDTPYRGGILPIEKRGINNIDKKQIFML